MHPWLLLEVIIDATDQMDEQQDIIIDHVVIEGNIGLTRIIQASPLNCLQALSKTASISTRWSSNNNT